MGIQQRLSGFSEPGPSWVKRMREKCMISGGIVEFDSHIGNGEHEQDQPRLVLENEGDWYELWG